MTTFFKDGIISKDGKNMGVKVPPVGTNAPGQNVASGNVPGFVSDAIAGAKDIFSLLSEQKAAKDRFVSSEQVIAAAPDIILASWCGKKVRPEKIAARDGWQDIPAVKSGYIYEIKAPLILQPGPAALTDGLDAICEVLS